MRKIMMEKLPHHPAKKKIYEKIAKKCPLHVKNQMSLACKLKIYFSKNLKLNHLKNSTTPIYFNIFYLTSLII
jgi:hypothetical protein